MGPIPSTFRRPECSTGWLTPAGRVFEEARKGTEDNRKGKKFFSIMVQGKYAEQIGDVLRRDFGVLTVSVQAKKGLVTKKDRQAFSSAL